MAFRLTRHIRERIAPSGDVTCLWVEPIWHSEQLGHINGSIRAVSTPDVGNTTTYSGPFANLEFDVGQFYCPFSIAAMYQPAAGSQPHVPASVAEWNAFMKKMVLTYGSASNAAQYGDADAAAAKLRYKDNPAEPDGTSSTDNTDAVKPIDYPSLGPQGFVRLSYQAKLLSSMTKVDAAVNSTATSVYTGDTHLNDMIFTDSMDLDQDLNLSGPGYYIGCVVRHKPVLADGFAASYGNESGVSGSNVLSASDKIAMYNALMSGDQLRIKEILRDRTTIASNYLRTILYMGDISIQGLNASNNPTIAAMFSDLNPIRQNDIMFTSKYELTFSTPYLEIPDLM